MNVEKYIPELLDRESLFNHFIVTKGPLSHGEWGGGRGRRGEGRGERRRGKREVGSSKEGKHISGVVMEQAENKDPCGGVVMNERKQRRG